MQHATPPPGSCLFASCSLFARYGGRGPVAALHTLWPIRTLLLHGRHMAADQEPLPTRNNCANFTVDSMLPLSCLSRTRRTAPELLSQEVASAATVASWAYLPPTPAKKKTTATTTELTTPWRGAGLAVAAAGSQGRGLRPWGGARAVSGWPRRRLSGGAAGGLREKRHFLAGASESLRGMCVWSCLIVGWKCNPYISRPFGCTWRVLLVWGSGPNLGMLRIVSSLVESL